MPIDILNTILDEVSQDLHGLIAFALTCKAALVVTKPHLLKALRSRYAHWAGTRIVCLGNQTSRDDDLPAGFLTGDERNEVKNSFNPLNTNQVKCYSLFAQQNYKSPRDGCSPRASLFRNYWFHAIKDLRATHPTAASVCDYNRFNLLHSDCQDQRALAYPEGEAVLFNLSKGECVRAGVVRALDTSDAVPISLTDALVSRICWSGDAPANNDMDLDEAQHMELGRGKWAGDRFCVATMAEMPLTPEGSEWVDVSEETAEYVYHLWRHAEASEPLCGTSAAKRTRVESGVDNETDDDWRPRGKKAKTRRAKTAPKGRKTTTKATRAQKEKK